MTSTDYFQPWHVDFNMTKSMEHKRRGRHADVHRCSSFHNVSRESNVRDHRTVEIAMEHPIPVRLIWREGATSTVTPTVKHLSGVETHTKSNASSNHVLPSSRLHTYRHGGSQYLRSCCIRPSTVPLEAFSMVVLLFALVRPTTWLVNHYSVRAWKEHISCAVSNMIRAGRKSNAFCMMTKASLHINQSKNSGEIKHHWISQGPPE